MKREGDKLIWDSSGQHEQCENALGVLEGTKLAMEQLCLTMHHSRVATGEWWKKFKEFAEPGEIATYHWPSREVRFRREYDIGAEESEATDDH